VKSLAKGLRILEVFTARESELLMSEVARRAELDNATAFRFLNTLTALGYVEKVGDTRKFRLTLRCLDLGFNAIARSDLRTLASPILGSLLGDFAEAASIGVLDGTDVVYIERMQAGLTRLGVDIRVGTRIPAYSSALGQAILAHMPAAPRAQALDRRHRPKLTDRTLTSLADLKQRLREVREKGYAVSDQETVPGLRAIAAPVLGADGLALAAISVAGASMTIPLEQFIKRYSGRLVESAAKLSQVLQAGGLTLMQRNSL
jgi:IclR family pca regulon transcriptional regulator